MLAKRDEKSTLWLAKYPSLTVVDNKKGKDSARNTVKLLGQNQTPELGAAELVKRPSVINDDGLFARQQRCAAHAAFFRLRGEL